MTNVFVFGTLKRGYGNHQRLLTESRFLGTAITAPEYSLFGLGGFPGIVHSGNTAIHGEVFEVDDATLARLDRLEGHPTWYQRQPMTVTLDDGTQSHVEGYVLPTDGPDHRRGEPITSGVWKGRQ